MRSRTSVGAARDAAVRAARGAAEGLCVSCTPWHSWKAGALAQGCRLCVQGRKLVLFVTGLCGQRCAYCPVGEAKFAKDVVYANEWKVEDPDHPVELLEEARLMKAAGAGITGGDPLVSLDRTCRYIRLLKRRFGKGFHIHLYTPLLLVTPRSLRLLAKAGLDEIRFHPNLDDKTLWPRLRLGRAHAWKVGVEIPVVPGYGRRARELVDYLAGQPRAPLVDFINLNELELSDTKTTHYALAGEFRPRDSRSYGVKGSLALAKRIAAYAAKRGLPAHVCTARLKDRVQMRERLRRRAASVALSTDKRTPAGTLIRGAIYLPTTKPGIGYRRTLARQQQDDALRGHLLLQLAHMRYLIMRKGIVRGTVIVDGMKLRLLLSAAEARRCARAVKLLHLVPAVVEEYPTRDGLEAEIEFI